MRTSARLASIDILRAFAACAVVITHLPFSMAGGVEHGDGASAYPRVLELVTRYGQFGVHLFLVLSGFCIHMQWARQSTNVASRSVGFLAFWKRRLHRLYPPYFVALVCSLIGLAVVAKLSGVPPTGLGSYFGYASTTQFLIDVAMLVLLAQNLNGAAQRLGNGPFWSLALEEQLYVLYFPLLYVRRRYGWTSALILISVVTFGWRAIFAFSDHAPGAWYFVGPARWLEWALGAVAVEAHLGMIKLPRWMSSGTVAVVLLALAIAASPGAGSWPRLPGAAGFDDPLFGVAFFVVVNCFSRLEREGGFKGKTLWPTIAKIGVMSYSLYLVHNPTMVVAKRVAIRLGVDGVVTLSVIRLVAAGAAGLVFFLLCERRFLNPARKGAGVAALSPERS